MNKLLTKIVGATLGLTMAVGVGVAVATNSKKAMQANAATSSDWTQHTGAVTAGEYLIVSVAGDVCMAPTGGDVAAGGYNQIAFTSSSAPADGFMFEASGTSFKITDKTSSTTYYVYASGTTNNGLRNGTSSSQAGSTWTIAETSTSGEYTIISETSRQISLYSTSNWRSYGETSGSKTNVKLYKKSSGPASDWVTSAIAITKTGTLAETIYNTTEDLPELDDVTVTKTEHDNNGVAADKDTNVTSSSTLHWIYADGTNAGDEVELPISTNGTYNVKIWASVAGETLTTKDNATAAKQYVTGTLRVTDEPQYVIVDSIVTSGNMSGNNDANSKFGLSSTEWSIVGVKQSASNLPGFGSDGTTRLYANASGGNYIIFKTLKANRYIVKISIEFNGNYGSGSQVREGEGTSGTAVAAVNGFYTFSSETTAFTLINVNSGNTQVRFDTIHIYYEDASITTPTIVLSNAPSSVGIGQTAQFTVEYFNLTANFVVTTNTTYVTASYTGATGTGETTVVLTGVAATNSTTITVSSTGATSQSFDVEVAVLPIIDASLNSLTWSGISYVGSPHTLTFNSSYEFVVSAGQFEGAVGYLGTNKNNPAVSDVSSDSWTLKGTSIATAMTNADKWSNYGQALYMSNFGVLHPTRFIVNAANTSSQYSADYYILASDDSGNSWTILTFGTVEANTDMSWSGTNYSANSNYVQFAFVTTGSLYGTISNVTVQVYGDSYATTKVLDSIYVSGTPKTAYFAGEEFDLNGATVKAHYTDSATYPDEDVSEYVSFSTITHGTTEVTISYMGKTTTVNVTVTDAGKVYKKITSAAELLDGSKVVVGTTNGNYLMGAQNTNNRISEGSHSYGRYDSGDVETYSVNTAEFTVGTIVEDGNTYYSFKDSDGKYLYAVSSDNNYLRSSSNLSNAGKWSIAFGENGSLQITAVVNYKIDDVATDVTKYMGGSAAAFGCYTTTTNYLSIYVDVSNNISVFGETYMHMSDYNTSQGWCSDSEHHYYVSAKAALLAMGDDYVDELQTNDAHSAILARYNSWANACKDSTPFAGEGIVTAQNSKFILDGALSEAGSVAAVVAIISLTTLTAVGGYFFLRKRKEEK